MTQVVSLRKPRNGYRYEMEHGYGMPKAGIGTSLQKIHIFVTEHGAIYVNGAFERRIDKEVVEVVAGLRQRFNERDLGEMLPTVGGWAARTVKWCRKGSGPIRVFAPLWSRLRDCANGLPALPLNKREERERFFTHRYANQANSALNYAKKLV